MTIYLRGPKAWRMAIAQHRRGDGEFMVDLLDTDDPLPAEACAYLAELVRMTARPGRRGRRKQAETVGTIARAWRMAQRYELELAVAKAARKLQGDTPSHVAAERTAEAFGVSVSTVKRTLKDWR
jgi:hypothetical protein